MQHVIIRFCGIALLILFLLTLGGNPPIAQAEPDPNRLLEGDYKYSAKVTCARDTTGFNENNNFQRQGVGSTFALAVQGDAHYNGDGTGTFVGQRLGINSNATATGQFPIGQADLDCDLTDTVNADGQVPVERA